jgi:pimeloyl-ACP methyl ester carboxylesterase
MARQLYALLVGINDYAPEVGKLAGCLNDVDRFQGYLTDTFDTSNLAVEVLKDADATRGNIIQQFRGHLGRATADDVALFLYCGHGAQWAAAKEFKEFYADGKDEGIVCYDSRRENGGYPYDLADKELAVLVAEVAKNNPHLAVIFDCCHSGSGTRDVDAFRHARARQTHEVTAERPLDSYIDGYYARRRASGKPLSIPTSTHVLMAACDRTEKAYEANDARGVFSSTLLKALAAASSTPSYADLFLRCRATIRKEVEHQTPQFEALGNFNARQGFLGRPTASTKAGRYSVSYSGGTWTVNAGALHGLPTEPEKSVGLALFPEGDGARAAGQASTTAVGPQKSEVKLDFDADPATRFAAEVTSLPTPPMPVYFAGDTAAVGSLEKALTEDRSVGVTLTDVEPGSRYALSMQDGELRLRQRETGVVIQRVNVGDTASTDSARLLLPALKQVAQWERGLGLQNHGTKMDTALVDLVFDEALESGAEHRYPGSEITLDYVKTNGTWMPVRGRIKVRNRTQQPLHAVLAYFSTSYGVHVLSNDPIPPGDTFVTLWGTGNDDYFHLSTDTETESIENFKLIVSTEPVDDFLLAQDPLILGATASSTRAIGTVARVKKLIHENEWFTKHLRFKIVRQVDHVGAQDTALAQGKIVIKGHPGLTAKLSLSAAKVPTRGVGDGSDFYKAVEGRTREGGRLELLNFSGTRGDSQSVLELTGIQNTASLKAHPLQIDVQMPLNEDEGILPFVFDGEHVLLGGDAYKDDNGHTQITIDRIPDIPDNRRSLGGSLKLYFFKTYLNMGHVNRLRWVSWGPGGACEYHDGGLAAKVTAAHNVLLLVHGIIGDTESMARGVKATGLDQGFDLVLTYDYENLSTPIEDTARALKARLAAAGLHEQDGKRLTLLVHSMGGLVSRWFIEREGGKTVVDHLVMCGTPNNGSPFGKIDGARKILSMLTGLAVNYAPMFVQFSGPLIFALNRSKKVTPTLEQMNPTSDFITTLNASEDPGIRYTILAGNVNDYKAAADGLVGKLLAKTGQGVVFDAIFGQKAHDIAVSVESILGTEHTRAIAPARADVACHHLNYFDSSVGQAALTAVEW